MDQDIDITALVTLREHHPALQVPKMKKEIDSVKVFHTSSPLAGLSV